MPYSIEKRNAFLHQTFPTLNNQATTYRAPSVLYLALSTNDPVEENGVFTELAGDTYARVLLARGGQDLPDYMSEIDEGKIYNVKQITFNRATVAWDQVKGIGLFTTNNPEEPAYSAPIFYAALKNPVDTAPNQIFTFDPNTFVVQFADTDVEIEAEASVG